MNQVEVTELFLVKAFLQLWNPFGTQDNFSEEAFEKFQ